MRRPLSLLMRSSVSWKFGSRSAIDRRTSPIIDCGLRSTIETANVAVGEMKSSDPIGAGSDNQLAIPERRPSNVSVA